MSFAPTPAALAEDLTYVHSTARLESKAEHVANLRAGKPHYRGIVVPGGLPGTSMDARPSLAGRAPGSRTRRSSQAPSTRCKSPA